MGELSAPTPGDSNIVDLDLSEPRVKAWLDALDHIDAAMALMNKNDGAWSSLAQAKTAAERTLGAMLFNRARDQRRVSDSGSSGEA